MDCDKIITRALNLRYITTVITFYILSINNKNSTVELNLILPICLTLLDNVDRPWWPSASFVILNVLSLINKNKVSDKTIYLIFSICLLITRFSNTNLASNSNKDYSCHPIPTFPYPTEASAKAYGNGNVASHSDYQMRDKICDTITYLLLFKFFDLDYAMLFFVLYRMLGVILFYFTKNSKWLVIFFDFVKEYFLYVFVFGYDYSYIPAFITGKILFEYQKHGRKSPDEELEITRP